MKKFIWAELYWIRISQPASHRIIYKVYLANTKIMKGAYGILVVLGNGEAGEVDDSGVVLAPRRVADVTRYHHGR